MLKFVQNLEEQAYTSVDQHTVEAICYRQLVLSSNTDDNHALVLSFSACVGSLPDSYTDDTQFAASVLPRFSAADLAAKQRADPALQHVIAQLERGQSPPPSLRDMLPDLPLLLSEVNKLELRNNLLLRRRQIGSNITYQLVLLEECRDVVMFQLHDKSAVLELKGLWTWFVPGSFGHGCPLACTTKLGPVNNV